MRAAKGERMPVSSLLNRVLDDEAITRGLGDAEARVLVEWLVERTERLEDDDDLDAEVEVQRLCRRARAVSRFVHLWCHQRACGAALQLAAVERFGWPLPNEMDTDAYDLMQAIVEWEEEQARR
jgi:hypothetical protein